MQTSWESIEQIRDGLFWEVYGEALFSLMCYQALSLNSVKVGVRSTLQKTTYEYSLKLEKKQ